MSGSSEDVVTQAASNEAELQPSQPQPHFSTSTSTDQIDTDLDITSETTGEAVNEEHGLVATEASDADAQLAAQMAAQEDAGYDSENDEGVPPPHAERLECFCGDQLTDQVEYIWLTCGHARCVDCVNTMVRVGLEKRGSFPPRCCPKTNGINLEEAIPFLNDEQVLRWFAVAEEYADDKPMYCGEKLCSKYLSKATVIEEGKWRLCEDCGGSTCTGCGALSSAHENPDECPERLAKVDKDFMEGKGWKPCANCSHMIERIDGCDHMTCENCHHEFCYGCGRSYIGGLPCNCHGQNPWVDDDPDANNMHVQQQALNNFAIAHGPGHRIGGGADEQDDGPENQENIRPEEDMRVMDEAADDNITADPIWAGPALAAVDSPDTEENIVNAAFPFTDTSINGILQADQARLQEMVDERLNAFHATRAHWANHFDRHGI